MPRTAAFTIVASLALLSGCAGMHPPPPAPAPAADAVEPAMSLRRAVRETVEAVTAAREAGSTLRACEVQAQYHIGTVLRAEEGDAATHTLRLGVIPEAHSAGLVTVTLVDDRCLARPRTPPAR